MNINVDKQTGLKADRKKQMLIEFVIEYCLEECYESLFNHMNV